MAIFAGGLFNLNRGAFYTNVSAIFNYKQLL